MSDGFNAEKYTKGITEIEARTPIAAELKEMALSASNYQECPELACMLLEIAAFEKHTCEYCKAPGHKRSVCPVFIRLRDKFRGDRNVNKMRGRKSMDLRINHRDKYRVRSGKRLHV